MKRLAILAIASAFPVLVSARVVSAQVQPPAAPAPSVPAERNSEDLLGGSFQAPMAGIAFRVPGSCQQIPKTGDEIARFANAEKTWEMVVSKTTIGQPLPLTGDGKKLGLLEVVAARLKQASQGVEIMRQDTTNLGETQAGIIIARMSAAAQQKKLIQQAIIQANDQLYYTFSLTTPSGKEATGNANSQLEEVAVNAFRQMLDTVKLLDRTAIKDDQNERLFRTRSLFTTLREKGMKDALVPEQWLRLLKDGKDIGYTYVIEEPGTQGPAEGIKIGIRSRSYPEQTIQVDGETWYFVSFDRRHETWRNLAWVQNIPTKTSDQFTEVGISDRQPQINLPAAARQGATASETCTLEVHTLGKAKNAAPVKLQVPPWYLPQALGHLLPRLLPIREPKTYMFAVYVSDQGHVMHRYVDVGTEQDAELAGQKIRAVPISDRVGLEGTPTIHYISADGKYLGSTNKDSKITILPSDAATLQKIWANKANLTRPREIEPEQKK